MIPMPSEAVATLGPMLTGVDAGNNTPQLRAFSALNTTCLHPNETRIGKQPTFSGWSRRFRVPPAPRDITRSGVLVRQLPCPYRLAMTAAWSAGDFNNRISNYSYVASRCRHLMEQLRQARFGRLDPNWRSNLQSISAQFAATGVQADAESTAIAELQNLPLMPWEPNQAPWRQSLDSWYAVAHKTLALDYVNQVQIHLNSMRDADMVGPLALTGILAEKILDTVSPHDNRGDDTRRTREWTYIGQRTSLTGSYLAGLSAGGVNVDWRGWYIEQIARWPQDHPILGRFRAEIQHGRYEFLPEYWMNEQTPS